MHAETLKRLAAWLEWPVRAVGSLLTALVLLVVVGEFAVVAMRYGWQWSGPWLREAVLALNAAVFLLGAAWALQQGEHVRVDVLSRRWSPRARSLIEFFGMLCVVLPFAGFVYAVSDDYVLRSHAIGERSGEAGGLPALWLQKALIPAMAVLLAVQALASAARALAGALDASGASTQNTP
jgi:TRAP-type mannitol/chloroaromatic compound transport system permease small subunit